MAKVYAELDERLRKFIVVQPIFLAGTGRSRSWARARGRDVLTARIIRRQYEIPTS